MPAARAWLSVSKLASLVEIQTRCLERWLAPHEHDVFSRFTVPKRRQEWLAGRIAAKELVRRRHEIAGDDALRTIEIDAAGDGPQRGKPYYRIGMAPGPYDLSISHSHDYAIAALAAQPGERIGIDIERIEERAEGFERLALSEHERDVIGPLRGEPRALAITERWVLKEALAKALGVGLRLPLDRVTVHLDEPAIWFESAAVDPAHAVHAQLAHVGSMCVGFVAIPPSS